ncbi:MAG: tagaturonate reductase, partial [Clostridia bacterium]|nr:tagaturonate reductase [Clostridia bacterium]
MIKVLQYGEGNFLRAFADAYFHTLNREGTLNHEYGVYVVKPTPSKKTGLTAFFEKQKNRYHVILRGCEGGKTVETANRVEAIRAFINPFEDHGAYIALADDPELKLVISNTTEAGICFNADDRIDGFHSVTYPAKLTQFLFARYCAGLDGLYILPAELIDGNADTLKDCVDRYIGLWHLPEGFKRWNDEKNFYCNTLVDRIVSGYPADGQTKVHLEKLIGVSDGLMTVAEPFGLWAIEKKGNISDYIKEGIHDIEVVLTDDIG